MADHAAPASGALEWSNWVAWVSVPDQNAPVESGVYGVVRRGETDGVRLHIGETIHLHHHLLRNLLGDKRPTAVGGRIMANEDVTQLLVRWTETVDHHAAKTELINRHLKAFGRYPEYMIAAVTS